MTPAPAKRGRKFDPNSKSGQIRALLASGMSANDIAKKVGCKPALVYNVKAKAAGPKKRGPGRPAKAATKAVRTNATTSASAGLDGILAAVRSAEQERMRLRAALEKIHAVLTDVLR